MKTFLLWFLHTMLKCLEWIYLSLCFLTDFSMIKYRLSKLGVFHNIEVYVRGVIYYYAIWMFFFLLFDFERFRPEEYCKGSKRFYRTCNIQVSINHIFALCVRILMWFWCDFSSFRFCFRFCFYFRIVQKVPGISALNSAKLTTTEHFKMGVDTVGSRIYQVR